MDAPFVSRFAGSYSPMPHWSHIARASLVRSLLGTGEAAAQGARSGPAGVLAAAAWADTGTVRAKTARPLPPSALAGRTMVFSGTALGEFTGPSFVTLSGGSVYRLEVLMAGGDGGPLEDAAVSNAHWLLDAESTPAEGVTVTPRNKNWPAVQILLPLDAGVRSVGGLDLLPRQAYCLGEGKVLVDDPGVEPIEGHTVGGVGFPDAQPL